MRARSIHLFPEPELHKTPKIYEPIEYHSFGWIDGVSATERSGNLFILLRGESDDPWASRLHSLDLYILQQNHQDESKPYLFPPTLVAQVPALRGSLRCCRVILGRCGTAAWIQPQDRAVVGLALANEDYPQQAIQSASGHESIMVAAFPGPLAPQGSSEYDGMTTIGSEKLCTNRLNDWTSLDYDEDMGRIVLSSSFGRFEVLEL